MPPEGRDGAATAAEPSAGTGEDYYRDLVETAPDAILVVDHRGLIELVNRQAEVLFGYSRDELIGQPVELLVPERARAVHPSHRASYFADPRTRPMGAGFDLTARRKDGREVPVDISLSPMHTERGTVVSVAIRDVGERKRAETALQEAYRKLASSVRDLERHDQDMTLINEMADLLQSCLTQAEANEVISRFLQRLFPSGSGAVFTLIAGAGAFDAAASWNYPDHAPVTLERDECWALRRARVYALSDSVDGPHCPHVGVAPGGGYVCVPMLAQGEELGLLHVRLDSHGEDERTFESQRILALAVAEHLSLALANLGLRETLRHQSVSDPLTGLFNRRYLQDYLTREILRCGRASRGIGVLVTDLDHFKEVNDRLGHGVGDDVLRAVARAVEANVRSEDTVCRYGGDEFVVILPDSSLAVAVQRAEHLRAAVQRLGSDPEGGLPAITLSTGVALFPDHGKTADDVLRAADAAMYQAKQSGRDRVAAAS